MKNYNILFLLMGLVFSMASCELDNYDGPNAALSGKILDQNGNLYQTTQGSGNMRIKLEDLSWHEKDTSVAIIPFYLNVKQDGTYNNDKLFSGKYRITPIDGAFYPYEAADTIEIRGHSKKDFAITPYLNVEWVTEPYLDTNGFIRASVKFTRNAKNGYVMPDLNVCQLFVSSTQYCGDNNSIGEYIGAPLTILNTMEGTTIELATIKKVKYVGTTYYVRAGISCKDATKNYNFTDIKPIVVGSDVVIP